MENLLKGKIAIITGSGRGIGKAIAELFVEQGAKVTVNDIDTDVCNQTAAEINEKYPNCAISCVADVTNKEQVQKMVDDTIAKFGDIDILVNNAGLTRDALIHKMDDKLMRLIIDINLKGTILCTQAVLPNMLKEERDYQFKKIVNFASTTGVSGNIGQTNYAVAKGGVIGFTKACAREYSLNRICVNSVAPSFIETRMTQEKKPGDKLGIPKAMRDLIINGIPFARDGRGGLPLDVAKLCLFFSSTLSDWITGQLLTCDGGTHI
ncbi:MAG: 3-oxoacyl-ACP reductase FabG [Candidatus Lokiarchaeota archaeon]|nr:3-oxoacyl-ACP reductase FabG [Candidatus Lokiarchaeota archaeon]